MLTSDFPYQKVVLVVSVERFIVDTDYGRKIAKSLIHIPNQNIHTSKMENHGLGTHIDKMYAKSSTGNIPQFILPIYPKRPIIWDSFEKAVITCPLSMIVDIIVSQIKVAHVQ